jgi:hypothetical protein
MSNQREQSFHDFHREVRELKGRMEQVLPSYLTGLERLSQLPEEFSHRFWASCLEALLAKVKSDYQKWQAQAQKADLLGKFMTLGVDVVLKAGGMEPIAPPSLPQLGVSISSSGKIEPDWMDNPHREPKAIFVTYDELMAIAQRVKDELLKGTVVPTSDEEIPKLVYHFASSKK